jgi:UDP-glucose 4-epimerase
MAVYGNGDAPFAETDKLEPIDPYGVAKMACERDIQIAGEQHGLEYCIVRPHNVFGEGQNIWDKYRNVIGIWMRQALYGEPITVYGDGEQQRAFSYIENCLQPLWNAGVSDASRNQIVNLGGRVPHTINEMCGMVMNATGAKIKTNKQCRHEVKKAFSTHEKSVMCLGYKEDISLEDGISSMWKWVNQLPVQRVRMFREYEIDRGVYEYWLPRKGRAPSGLNELKGTCYTGGNIK